MSYEAVDHVINAWAARQGLTVITEFGDQPRRFCYVGVGTGESFRVSIEPPENGIVTVRLRIIGGVSHKPRNYPALGFRPGFWRASVRRRLCSRRAVNPSSPKGRPVRSADSPPLAEIHALGITPVRVRQRRSQSVRVAGNQDQMDVIRHQAIGPDLYARRRAALGQQAFVGLIVVVGEEHRLPAIASLGDMVRGSLHHKSSQTRHEVMVSVTFRYAN